MVIRRRFRRRDYIVEAEQNSDGSWTVFDCGSQIYMGQELFEKRFEEVSPLHRVQPLRIETHAEGVD